MKTVFCWFNASTENQEQWLEWQSKAEIGECPWCPRTDLNKIEKSAKHAHLRECSIHNGEIIHES